MSPRTRRILAYSAVVLVAIFSVWAAKQSADRANQNARDLQAGLIESCEVNGNPLRAAVRQFGVVLIGEKRSDIEQSAAFEKSGAYGEFFPGIPADRLHALLLKQRREKQDEIKGIQAAIREVPGVDCAEQYR